MKSNLLPCMQWQAPLPVGVLQREANSWVAFAPPNAGQPLQVDLQCCAYDHAPYMAAKRTGVFSAKSDMQARVQSRTAH